MQMANKHMKRCLTSLIIREMQIKSTMRYHIILFRMASIKKSTNKCWRECESKGILLQSWWECKLIWPLWRILWRFLKTLGRNYHMTQQSYYWVYTLRYGFIIEKDTCTPMFTAALFTIGRTWKQPRCPSMDEWI